MSFEDWYRGQVEALIEQVKDRMEKAAPAPEF